MTGEPTAPTAARRSGHRGSRPVRINNGASDQLQLDIYGEALDSIFFADQRRLPVGHRSWMSICELLDWLAEHWDQPDEGNWETRGGRKAVHLWPVDELGRA